MDLLDHKGITIKIGGSSHGLRSKGGMLGGIIVGLALVSFIICYMSIRRRRMMRKKMEQRGQDEQALRHHLGVNSDTISVETFLQNYTSVMPTRYSYKQIKKYSNNFSDKLGQGGFGSVFKAKLPNGSFIAIKVLDETEQSETQFLNEVRTVGQINHNHLVQLLGYCFENSRRILVYEYMVNGSLEKYIHARNQDSPEMLTWSQLHEIAVGTARGITYLHEECRSRILHCDIKPHNILLDATFMPKVSDFGLARTVNRENSHVSLTCGRGTPGYAPPEMWWQNYGPVSEKSDVYSFGMVLLEMAGKRKNFEGDMSRSSEMYFPEWVFSHHVEQVGHGGSKWHACADEEEEKTARRMELVGLWCIQLLPTRRPSMRKVIEMLEGTVVINLPPAPFDATLSRHVIREEPM